jgi:hypothetical protein
MDVYVLRVCGMNRHCRRSENDRHGAKPELERCCAFHFVSPLFF